MHSFKVFLAAIAFVLAACGVAAAQNGPAQANLSPAERTAILKMMKLTADAKGQVMNECGDKVTPSFLAADLGGAVGTATLFAIGGGPSMATCYGDGPDLHLFKKEGSNFREIYSARGRMLVIMPGKTKGVRDIVDGGPGFSFPLWQWNGKTYANSGRMVPDSALNGAVAYLP